MTQQQEPTADWYYRQAFGDDDAAWPSGRGNFIAMLATVRAAGYRAGVRQGERRVEAAAPVCDHAGIEHGPFSYVGICPRCGRCKFIGHGPLCMDCFVDATARGGAIPPEQAHP